MRKGALSYTMGAFPLSGGRVRGRGGRRGYRLKIKKTLRDYLGLFLTLPGMFLIIMILVVPLFCTVYSSLFKLDHLQNGGFVGFKNYVTLFQDPGIWASFGITILVTLVSAGISMVLGLVFALWIDRRTGAVAYLIQLIGLLPWVISMMVGTVLWRWILNGDTGLFNYFLRCLGIAPVAIFENKTASLVTLIVVMAWRTIGYSMVMILAGLKGVDKGLLEAARVDGANTWQALMRIKLPLIKTPMLLSTIVLTMSNFNNNTVPLILTGGGPGTATNVISLELYRMGFTYYKFGLASALSVLVFLVNIVFVVLYVRMIKYDV
ncbi:sugar ABC transporter permease [Ruthenibacterium lactatiformans]|uniref:Sugar ABC transporter permease n=2 Tax=Ruthenibacterium lactatiformans TaxID=1550024 RepID=A0A6I2UAQ4_9FIRM|nr:sugar ABC transporter permease [Ruthenibacterium lactatiformans]